MPTININQVEYHYVAFLKDRDRVITFDHCGQGKSSTQV
jgi:hypothetical protein